MIFYTKSPCWLPAGAKKFLLIMRITTLLLIVSIMQVSATGFAQRLTMKQKNITLKEFFREIKKQTGYNVSYSDQLINDNKRLDVNYNNTPLTEVLGKSLDAQQLSFKINEKDITIEPKIPSLFNRILDAIKAIDIRGKVLDDTGKPLPGAVIKVKGTGISLITNNDGEFVIRDINSKTVRIRPTNYIFDYRIIFLKFCG